MTSLDLRLVCWKNVSNEYNVHDKCLGVNGQRLVYDHLMLSIISPVKSKLVNSLYLKFNVPITN